MSLKKIKQNIINRRLYMKYVIGVDVGTSGTKTILFSQVGEVIYESNRTYNLNHLGGVSYEQNPLLWKRAVLGTLKEVVDCSDVDSNDIVSIGLSGQMHGLVLLDDKNELIREAIIWCDQRAVDEVKELEKVFGSYLVTSTCNVPQVSFTLAKLLWVKNHEPEQYKRIKHILLPKDYVRFVLSNNCCSEYSDISGTQLLNLVKKTYDEKILSYLELDKNVLPTLFESNEVTGTISEEVAKLTGLSPKTVIVGGAGDQAASALGNGIIKPGDSSISLGSSGVVFVMTDKCLYDLKGRVQTFCHAVKDSYHIMGVTQGAGLSMKWFKDNLCQDLKGYNELNEKINSVSRGSNGVFFLPYLNGERSPHLDINAKGVFFGLSYSTTKVDMGLAVMEGVAYSLKDCHEVIKELGVNINSIRLGGGGAKSKRWQQIMADVLNNDVMVNTSSQETGCLGVAILAACGANLYPSLEQAVSKMVGNYNIINKSEDSKFYQDAHKLYKKLYLDLKNSFKLLSELS